MRMLSIKAIALIRRFIRRGSNYNYTREHCCSSICDIYSFCPTRVFILIRRARSGKNRYVFPPSRMDIAKILLYSYAMTSNEVIVPSYSLIHRDERRIITMKDLSEFEQGTVLCRQFISSVNRTRIHLNFTDP